MTFTEQIEAALAKPMDKDCSQLAQKLYDEWFSDDVSCEDSWHALYTLLLRIRELEKQVEQERWRDANKEKPEHETMVLCFSYGQTRIAHWNEIAKRWLYMGYDLQVTHWKPINTPA